jgi:hypothetical protein
MRGFFQWLLSLRFPHQNPVCTFSLLIRATWPAHVSPGRMVFKLRVPLNAFTSENGIESLSTITW